MSAIESVDSVWQRSPTYLKRSRETRLLKDDIVSPDEGNL